MSKQAWTSDKATPPWLNLLIAKLDGEPVPPKWFKRRKSLPSASRRGILAS
jgi:hypothetical protein